MGDVPDSSDGSAGQGAEASAFLLNDPAALLSIADSLPVFIAYIDRDERFLFVNRPLCDWIGIARGDMLGRTMREVIDPVTYASREAYLRAALAGERQVFDGVYDHPTRGPLANQVEYVPHLGRDGQLVGLVLVGHDMTERRAAELALRESEARFRRIADFAPVLMWVTRTDRTRDFVNRAYADFAGLPDEQARTHDWRAWIHPDDFERVVAESLAGEASLQPFTMEARYRRHDGEWRWLRSVSSPRLGPDGDLIGFIGAASDVTVAKQAELELRREVEQRTRALAASEARFRAIFDSVMEVMVLLDPDGTVVEVNRTAAAWRDANPQRAIGQPIWAAPTLLAYPGHELQLREGVAAAARGETYASEVRLDGDPVRGAPSAWLDVTVQPVRDGDGAVRHLLFEARDITDLKQAQEQLRQSQKMEALGQLTGGIAHDFNNLLTVVVGGLDLITKKIEDEKLLRYATNALSAAERGVRLTGQLLTFSRSQRLEVRPCYVAPLIEEMRPLLRNVLGPGIEKKFDLDDEMVPVMADPTQLEVAVLNLAINARDAMPDGGTLRIATTKVTIGDDPELDPGDYIEVAISDTGSGMVPEVAARAFEPFFTTKEVGKGTGLGLSMVYGMARQSGGTARIESEPGKGTSIHLYFRRADREGDPELAQGSARGAVPARAAAVRVVVIDDDPDVRDFIAGSLAELGYDVEQAADGASGIALVERLRPDVVVLDYVMPGMSGAEVAKTILASRPEQAILFVSGYSETDEINRAAPRATLLTKPFRSEALGTAVQTALGNGI